MFIKPTKFMMAEDPKKSGGAGDDDGDKDEKLAAMIAAAVSKSVNAAVTERFRRESAKVEERFKALEAKKAGGGEDDDADDDAGGEPGAATPPKAKGGAPDPAMVALQKRLERTEKQLADQTAAREKAVADGKVRDERAALQDALTAAGVRKEMLPAAVALLYGEQKKVKRTEEDKMVFVGDDEAEMPLADGAKAWAKSEVGQQFLPPRNAGGSGGTGGGKPQGGGGGGQPDTSDRAIIDMLLGSGPAA